ncbi:hypothetical protein HZA98_04850 [Candidatus Woesearchaeota archaeon]|nr:hypothetical protein [Candidatus Woesearchaeota archaeon]
MPLEQLDFQVCKDRIAEGKRDLLTGGFIFSSSLFLSGAYLGELIEKHILYENIDYLYSSSVFGGLGLVTLFAYDCLRSGFKNYCEGSVLEERLTQLAREEWLKRKSE